VANYPSTTFGLNGTLYGWGGGRKALDIIDPCTCEVTEVGPTMDENDVPYTHLRGITADGRKEETLFGLSTELDVLVELDVSDATVAPIGDLGIDFHYSGTTWSPELNGLYALNDITDELYVLHTETGLATPIAELDIDIDLVGIEYHIASRNLFTCTNPNAGNVSKVFLVDVETGITSEITTLSYMCNNLAAPWQPVPCVDAIPFE